MEKQGKTSGHSMHRPARSLLGCSLPLTDCIVLELSCLRLCWRLDSGSYCNEGKSSFCSQLRGFHLEQCRSSEAGWGSGTPSEAARAGLETAAGSDQEPGSSASPVVTTGPRPGWATSLWVGVRIRPGEENQGQIQPWGPGTSWRGEQAKTRPGQGPAGGPGSAGPMARPCLGGAGDRPC